MERDEAYETCFAEQYAKGVVFELPAAHLVAPYCFSMSTAYEDRSEGVDVINMYPRLSVRTRPFDEQSFDLYKHQFTIRTRTPYTRNCEFRKIWEGKSADGLVYCWTDMWKIVEWMFLDLKVLREAFKKMDRDDTIYTLCKERESPNGTHFLCCDIRHFPKDLVIKSSFELEK